MVLIRGGNFEMGDAKSDPEEWTEDAQEIHSVELDSFYMNVHEVTVGEFKQFISFSDYNWWDNNPNRWNEVAKYSPGNDYPMIFVSWHDAVAYAKWAGKRLPTEAEWEYSARGGLTGKRYPWKDQISHEQADYSGVRSFDMWEKCSPVGSFVANSYGLSDMAGNVWEWCNDWYAEDSYSISLDKDPIGPKTGEQRVLRGGSWNNRPFDLRVAYRNSNLPNNRHFNLGFRCASELTN